MLIVCILMIIPLTMLLLLLLLFLNIVWLSTGFQSLLSLTPVPRHRCFLLMPCRSVVRGRRTYGLIDSECSQHMTGDSRWFSSLTRASSNELIIFGDVFTRTITAKGTVSHLTPSCLYLHDYSILACCAYLCTHLYLFGMCYFFDILYHAFILLMYPWARLLFIISMGV